MEEEETFKHMWQDARVRFEETTKQSPKPRNIEDVLKELDKRFNPDDPQDGGKQRRIKELATNVLQLIKLIGGLAAQGVSMAFGPVTLCFNALQYLVSIPAKISKFYEDLAILFEEISTFMSQFKIYRRIEQYAEVGMELKQCTHRVMIVFVDICILSIDILSGSRWKRTKSLVKIALFDNDSGVGAKLEEFKRLVASQGRVADVVTLEHVLKSEEEHRTVYEWLKNQSEVTESQLGALVKDAKDRTVDTKQKELTAQVFKKLSIEDERIQKLEKDFDLIRSDRLQDTGTWLKDMDAYKSWADTKTEAGSQLLLSGSNGSGKSYLAFAVLDDLMHQHSITSNSAMRTSFAYHRFASNEKLARDDAAKDALKFMAAQIAAKNISFLKGLTSHLESRAPSYLKDTSVKELYQDLLPPPSMRDIPDMTYVLLFDGLDQLSGDAVNELFAAILAMKSSKIRVLVTGTEETLRSCLSYSGKAWDSVQHVRFAEHNDSDIKSFIDSTLKECRVLKGKDPSVLRIVEEIQSRLPEVANGNFDAVKQVIDVVVEAITSELSVEDILDLISIDTLRNKDTATEKLVKELQASLKGQEIEQLNELLMWALYAYEYMSVDQLRAALFLRTKRTPLQALEEKLTLKYYKLLQVNPDNYDFVEIRDSYLETYFRTSARREQRIEAEENRDPKISMRITIDNVKLSKVQRFFWDLSEKVVLDKFTFSNALTDLGDDAAISANQTDSHLALTRRCFELILEEPKEETRILDYYALRYLPLHLDSLKDDIENGDLLSTAEREDVVENLVSLFQSIECIQERSDDFFLSRRWLGDVEVEAMQWWLRDSDYWGKLNRKELNWLKQATLNGKPLALSEVAIMVARQWLCHRAWSAELPYQWLDAFLDRWPNGRERQTPKEDPSSSDIQNGSNGDTAGTASKEDQTEQIVPPRERIIRAAEWVENEIKITKDSLYYERLGYTYFDADEIELSINAFSAAKELPDHSRKVSEGLAHAYERNNRIDLALEEAEVMIAQLRGKELVPGEDRDDLARYLRGAARWQSRLGNTMGASDKLREAIRVDEDYLYHYDLLNIYMDTDQTSEALKHLSDLSTQDGTDGSANRFESMLLSSLKWNDTLAYLETIYHLVRNHDLLHVVIKTLDNALMKERDNPKSSTKFDLLLCHGVAIAHYSSEGQNSDSVLAQWQECSKFGFQSDLEWHWDAAMAAARFVFNHYFSEARLRPDTAHDLEPRIEELKTWTESPWTPFAAQRFRRSIGSFYYLLGNRDAVRNLFLKDIKSALDILSDDDPQNDDLGYDIIGGILTHTGDDINALTAWSLYLFPPVKREDADIRPSEEDHNTESPFKVPPSGSHAPTNAKSAETTPYTCDGKYNKPITYGDSIWFCKVCDDIQFHTGCLQKLRTGTLARFVCGADHEWLHVASWEDEYKPTGKGRVRVGGEIRDGKRIGGEIVTVEQWLDTIRDKWGIEKPTPSLSNGDNKQTNEQQATNSDALRAGNVSEGLSSTGAH